jgi:hypothetical protein
MKDRRAVAGVASALLALFAIDAVVFRTSLYPSLVEPQSTTGSVEIMNYVEMNRKPSRPLQALAFGNSRMGFLPRLATEVGAPHGVEFASVAVPGTSPRCWFYELRDLDPEARRYTAVVLPVEDYDDEDRSEDPDDSIVDLHYAIARLRLADVLDFAYSFRSWRSRWMDFRGSLLKGAVYKDDLQAYLLDPDARRRKVRLYRSGYVNWIRGFEGTAANLDGLRVDWTSGGITYPPGATPKERKTLYDVLLRQPVPQTGRLAQYNREWFGRIIDRYRGTRTRVIFFRLPRGPVVRPTPLVTPLTSSIREFAARPNVVLLDERAFEAVERTDCFGDPLHMNAKGMSLFSRMLAARVIDSLQLENAVQ